MLITKDNFKYQRELSYNGDDKYPRYILRGKKISKELAEKIIVTETKADFLEFNHDIKNYKRYSIKKPLSIRETKDEEYREKCINGIYDEPAIDNLDESDGGNFDSAHFEQYFEDNTPLSTFVDANGFVGATGVTYKYPMPFEYLVDHLEYSNRYPFLEYVIIYTDYDGFLTSNYLINFSFTYPPLLTNIDQMLEAFTYALYIHDGGVEVVNMDEAIKLYKKYQKEYANDLIFERDDYDKYVKNTFNEYNVPLFLKNWEIKPLLRKEIEECYKKNDTIIKIDERSENEKNTYIDDAYLKYKNMSIELENIHNGKETKLAISKELYEMIKKYLDLAFKYHDRLNKVRNLEAHLKTVLSVEDYNTIHTIVYTYKYDREIMVIEYKEEVNKECRNFPLPLSKKIYEIESKMFDELEHIRKGEQSSLNYDTTVINRLKEYLDVVVEKDFDNNQRYELDAITILECELQSKMDWEMYKLIMDTIVYTKSSSYDLEKEYEIYNACRELNILFLNDVKDAVKREDFELKSVDDKSYIAKFNNLCLEYKKIVNPCLI